MNQQSSFGAADLLGDFQLRDYVDIVRRRLWWICLTLVAVSITTAVIVMRMPDIYKSETVILVDPQKVPDNYVASTVSTGISDRLSTIQQQVMSPTRLKQLIDTMNLYPALRGKVPDQELINRMQRAMAIEVVDQGGRRTAAFRIAFTGRNPVEVAQVANQLAAMFINDNLKVREQQSYGTAEFLENELQKTKEQLETKETELRDIKSKYVMDLPESKQFHLEALTSLRNQIRSSEEKVGRAQQEKLYLQSVMVSTAPSVDLDSDEGAGGNSPLQSQIQKLESRQSELMSRYGANHPDVRKVRNQVEELKAKAAKEEALSAPSQPRVIAPTQRRTIRNPVIEAQMQALNKTIEEETKLQAQLQSQIAFHQSKLERVPVFEQTMAGLLRDYDTLKGHYTSLLDKKLSADTASALESRQKGERFVILDAAQVPEKPASPNRPMLFLAGVLGGLIGGIALALVKEFTDGCVRTQAETERILETTVLVDIPRIHPVAETRRAAVKRVLTLTATASGSAALGFVISVISARFF